MIDIPSATADAYANYFVQELTPIGGSLVGSFFVGLIPLILVLVLLGIFRIPAHYAAISSLVVCIFVAIFAWRMPAQQAFSSIAFGLVFANWPIMWIVFNAMVVYNVTVRSGIFDVFRRWMLTNAPPDKRVYMIILGFSFCAILEGIAGFGAPAAICAALLVSLGMEPLIALSCVLIFDTTPVAFGALGIPVTTLASLTGLPVMSLSAMLGRQLPLFSLFMPLYASCAYAGFRAGLIECWPLCLVAGLSFSVTQAIFSNLVGPELPDLISGLVSLVVTIVFTQFWKPRYREEYKATLTASATTMSSENSRSSEGKGGESSAGNDEEMAVEPKPAPALATIQDIKKPTLYEALLAWSPWAIITITVIIWTFSKASSVGEQNVQWPHLHNRIWITLYNKPYSAVWDFQPLATGTAILIGGFLFDFIVVALYGCKPNIIWLAVQDAVKQLFFADITVSFIMALAYLYNYSGIAYTVGLTLSQVGKAFPFLSAWVGWLGCFLSGSDTSANSLFGNLQVVAANEIGLSAILMAATNSSGAITSKMISPQTLTTGVSTIGMRGKEGMILRHTIIHSVILVCLIGALACFQQYVIPGIIPSGDPSQ